MRENTCKWNNERGMLEGGTKTKILKYLSDKLIRPDMCNKGLYYIDPCDGRNLIHTVDSYLWTCTCQHYHQYVTDCSHILAVRLFQYQVANNERNPMEGWLRLKEEARQQTKEIPKTQEGNLVFGVVDLE